MVCDLGPSCNFLFGYFSFTLLDDIDITVCTLKGIHTFRKDQTMQVSKCTPWGMGVQLFPSLKKKIKDYIGECHAIANPFTYRSYPYRPNPSPFTKQSKAIPVKRSATFTRHNVDILAKPRKINVGCDPAPFQ